MARHGFLFDGLKDIMGGGLSQTAGFPIDMGALMDMQRKNFEALSELQSLAVENAQAFARQQTEILSRIAANNSQISREILSEDTPQDKVATQTELVRKVYEKSVAGFQELAEIVEKSNREASGVINRRVKASLQEFERLFEKEPPESSAPRGVHKKAA